MLVVGNIAIRVIAAGGSISVSPCKLVAIAGGNITDRWSRNFASPPGSITEFHPGTAPTFDGRVTASQDSVVFFDFGG